jgi:hypothetical protein
MFSHSHELQGDPHKGAVFASAQRCHQQQRQAIDSVDSFFFEDLGIFVRINQTLTIRIWDLMGCLMGLYWIYIVIKCD